MFELRTHSRRHFPRLSVGIFAILFLPRVAFAAASPHWSNDAVVEWAMQRVYGTRNTQFNCWPTAFANEMRFCMQVRYIRHVSRGGGERWYILASGDCRTLSPELQCTSIASGPGLIGAFAIALQAGKLVLTSQAAQFPAGDGGEAPRQWRLVQLGANGYYGWVGTETTGDSGCFTTDELMLAPDGKDFAEIGDIVLNVDNSGACDPSVPRCLVSFDARVHVNPVPAARVYPLEITYWGKDGGTTLHRQGMRVRFSFANWEYLIPSVWPGVGC